MKTRLHGEPIVQLAFVDYISTLLYKLPMKRAKRINANKPQVDVRRQLKELLKKEAFPT